MNEGKSRWHLIEILVDRHVENTKKEINSNAFKLRSILINGFSGYARYTDSQLLEMVNNLDKE